MTVPRRNRLLFTISGCGPKTARLTGRVRLGGQPVPNAEIEFAPIGAGGLPLGEYQVKVTVHLTKAGALLPEGEAGAVLMNSGQAVARSYVLALKVDKTAQVDLNLDAAKL